MVARAPRQFCPFFSIVTREPLLDPTTLILTLVIGTIGGVFGGLFGIGGGIVIIPLLTLVQGSDPHLYQAASLVAAILVSLGSIPRHIRARAIEWGFAWRTIPISIIAVAGGVWISNSITDPVLLERIFAAFLLYVAGAEVWRQVATRSTAHSTAPSTVPSTARPTALVPEPMPRTGWGPATIVGTLMGALAGLLGIGGGVIAVPLMRTVNGFSLRTTIATSAFMILPTVIIGMLLKFSTLSHVRSPAGDPLTITAALWIAGGLAPGAFFGAMVGASFVHKLPARQLAVAFALLCVALSLRMLGIAR